MQQPMNGDESRPTPDTLQPGERVIDLRGLVRSGGMFAGLASSAVAIRLCGWDWTWCVMAAFPGAAAGLILAGTIAPFVFPAPAGQVTVTLVGPGALGVALRAAVAGGGLISLASAMAALANGGWVEAAVVFAVGLSVSMLTGVLSALL